MKAPPQPWPPAVATRTINSIAGNPQCSLSLVKHVKERLSERGLLISDLLFVLKNGFVYEESQPSTVPEYFKYRIEGQSPNSGSRYLRVVAIADEKSCSLKAITIMWRDEN
jgi:Domain of unknown function (DUF4258)